MEIINNNSYYITVDKYKKRQLFMEKQLKKYKMNVKKFLGVDKDTIQMNYFIKNGYIKLPFKISKEKLGSLSCALSHILLYKKILKENKDNDKNIFLIFEDDAIILPKFKEKLFFYITKAPKDWDMIWLGYNKVYGKLVNKYFYKPFNKMNRFNSCHHCYLVKKSSIEKILNILVPLNYIQNIYSAHDICLRNNFHKFNAYFINNKMAVQNMNFISKRTGKKNG